MKLARLVTIGALFLGLLIGLLLLIPPSSVYAASCTWTGAVNDNWSETGNWSGCGAGAPDADDVAVINTGTIVVDSQVTVLGVIQSGGTVTGTFDLAVTDVFTWVSGTQSGSGATIISPTASLVLDSGTNKVLAGRTLNLYGTGSWPGGGAVQGSNNAVFHIYPGGSLTMLTNANLEGNGNATLINEGTMTKAGGTDITQLDIHFQNVGSIHAVTGTMQLNEPNPSYTHSGAFTVAAGAKLQIASNQTFTSGSSISGDGLVQFSSGTSIISGTLGMSGLTELRGGTVVLNSVQPTTIPTVHQASGVLTGSGELIVTDVYTWTSGVQSGSGATVITTTATLVMETSAIKFLSGRTLNLYGTGSWPGSGEVQGSNNAVLHVHPGGSLTMLTNANLKGSANATLINEGMVTKVGGTNTTQLDIVFHNVGTIHAGTGTVQLNEPNPSYAHSGAFTVAAGATLQVSSNQTFASGSSISGDGKVQFSSGTSIISGTLGMSGLTEVSGGTVILNSLQPTAVPTLQQTAGVLTGASDLIVTGVYTWTSGTRSGSGTTVITTTATLVLEGSSAKQLNGHTLHLYGVGSLSGSGALQGSNNAIFHIHPSGSLTILSDANFEGDANGLLINEGTLIKDGATGMSALDIYLHNVGTIQASTGIVHLDQDNPSYTHSGAFTVAAGATLRMGSNQTFASGSSIGGDGLAEFTGGMNIISGTLGMSGLTELSGGTVVLNSVQPTTIPTLLQTSGVLTGTSELIVTDVYTWTGGTQSGSGTTVITTTATLVLAGGSPKLLNGHTLHLYGVGSWPGSGNFQSSNNALFRIHPGSSLTILSDANFTGSTNGMVLNEGTITKTGGTNITQLDIIFHNVGTIHAGTGTVQLNEPNPSYTHSGAFTVAAGATLRISSNQTFANGSSISGDGVVQFTGNTSIISGTLAISGLTELSGATVVLNSAQPTTIPTLQQTAGVLTGASDLIVTGVYTWTSGTRSGSGTTVITTTAALVLGGTSAKQLNGHTLHLYGVGSLSGSGAVQGSNNAIFHIHPSGSLTILSDANFEGDANGLLINEGTLIKDGATGMSALDIYLHNVGTIQASTGIVHLDQDNPSYTHSGAFTVAAGATLRMGSNQTFASGSSIGGDGLAEFTGGMNIISGTLGMSGLTELSGGTVVLNSVQPTTIPTLLQTSGVLTGTSELIVTDVYTWTGGTQSGSGTTVITTTATLVLAGGSPKLLNGHTLHLYGVGSWPGSGNFQSSNNALFRIHPGSSLTILSDANFTGSTNGMVLNEGTITKTGGTNITQLDIIFHNVGTIHAGTGTVQLNEPNPSYTHSGAFTVAAGATLRISSNQTFANGSSISGDGVVQFTGNTSIISGTLAISGLTELSGATVVLNSAQPTTIPTLQQTAGVLTGASDLIVTGVYTWTSGTRSGSGTTVITTTAALVLGGTSAKQLNGHTLHLYGVGSLSGSGAVQGSNNAIFHIHPSGSLTILSDANFEGDANGLLINEGTLIKDGATGMSALDIYLHNVGTIQASTGIVRLEQHNPSYTHSGAFTVAAGATLRMSSNQTFASGSSISGDGLVRFTGGTNIISGTYALSGLTELSAGIVDFDAASSIIFGDLKQTGGNLYLDNAVTITGHITRTTGVFDAGAAGTFTFASTSVQQVDLRKVTSFRNMIVTAGTTVIEIDPADNFIVLGMLTNNGVIRKTQTAVPGAVSFGLTSVQMDIASLGTLGAITVDRLDVDHPGVISYPGLQTGRFWSINASGFGYTLTMTLPHAALSDPNVCRFIGSSWSCDRTSFDASSVTRTNLTGLSDWTVGQACAAPPVAPALTVTQSGANTILVWTGATGWHEVWASSDPYLALDNPGMVTPVLVNGTMWTDVGGSGGSSYYQVRALSSDCGVASPVSNTTGVFSYPILPGVP